jgi:hypothetical protein
MCAETTLPGRGAAARTEPGLWTTAAACIAALAIGYGSLMVEGPVPDSAMDTKSEEGEPGDDERDDSPLDADEQAMLERLRAAGVTVPEQESGSDTTLPPPPPAGGPDPLDPVFREPNP